MDDLGTKWNRHKQPVRGTAVRHMTINICFPDPLFNSPGNGPYHTGGRQYVRRQPWSRVRVKQTRKCICFSILGTRAIRQGKIKPIKEQSPPGLSGIESFGGPDVLKVLMISPNQEWLLCSLQPMSPFFHGHFNGQQLPFSHVVIPFSGREFPRQKGAGVKLLVRL